MQPMILRLTADTVATFGDRITPLLDADTTVDAEAEADGTLQVRLTLDPAKANDVANAARTAGIEVMPMPAVPTDLASNLEGTMAAFAGTLAGSSVLVQTLLILPEFEPYFPYGGEPAKETLKCGESLIIADGAGEGREFNTTQSSLAEARDESIEETLEQIQKAITKVSVACPDGCTLQLKVLMAKPEEAFREFAQSNGQTMSLEVVVTQKWELSATCVKTPTKVEEVPADAAKPCGKVVLTGTGLASDSESDGSNFDLSVIDEVREEALGDTFNDITKAIEKLPPCSASRCPEETYELTLTPARVRVKKEKRKASGIFKLRGEFDYTVEARAEIDWTLTRICS